MGKQTGRHKNCVSLVKNAESLPSVFSLLIDIFVLFHTYQVKIYLSSENLLHFANE